MNDRVVPEAQKSLNIAFVSQYFFPEQFSNNAITEELVRRGHSVDVVTGVPNYGRDNFFEGYSNRSRREEEWKGAKIYRARSVARGKSKLRLLLNYMTFPVTGSWTALRKVKRRPDVVFASLLSPVFQAIPAIILSRWHKSPLVYWVQDIWPESAIYTLKLKNKLLKRTLTAISAWILRQADLVLVQSAAFPPMLTRFGIPIEKIAILPNTAPEMYVPMAREKSSMRPVALSETDFCVMFAGNIGESQDFDTLLEAAHKLRKRNELHWVIIGNGRDLDRVRDTAAELCIAHRFHLLGRHPEEQIPHFFSHADALIVSLKQNAIFDLTVPYKIQCYMACGRPIIASIGGEGARVVEEAQAGLVSFPSDPVALAASVERLMDMPSEQRKAMGVNARKYYEAQYSRTKVYSRLEGWLQSAAAGRQLKSSP